MARYLLSRFVAIEQQDCLYQDGNQNTLNMLMALALFSAITFSFRAAIVSTWIARLLFYADIFGLYVVPLGILLAHCNKGRECSSLPVSCACVCCFSAQTNVLPVLLLDGLKWRCSYRRWLRARCHFKGFTNLNPYPELRYCFTTSVNGLCRIHRTHAQVPLGLQVGSRPRRKAFFR